MDLSWVLTWIVLGAIAAPRSRDGGTVHFPSPYLKPKALVFLARPGLDRGY